MQGSGLKSYKVLLTLISLADSQLWLVQVCWMTFLFV